MPKHVLAALFDQSRDCIKVIGADGRLDYMTPNGRLAMEVDDFSQLAGRYWWDLWPPESQHLIRKSVVDGAAGRSSTFEAFCPTAKGTPRWWEVSVTPIVNGETVEALVSTSRDITERVRERQHLEEIAIEMRHRVRNAYAVCIALTALSSRADAGHEAFAASLSSRLENVAKAQSALLDVGTGEENAAQVVSAICRTFDMTGQRIRLGSVSGVVLPARTAQTIALVLGELCTNSLKYGALLQNGTIDVTAQQKGRALEVEWQEKHGGRENTESQSSSNTGLDLIRRLLRLQSGSFEYELGSKGLYVRFSLPLGD